MNEPLIALNSGAGEAPVRRFALAAPERPLAPEAAPRRPTHRASLRALLPGARTT
jgi:hypothetical protein